MLGAQLSHCASLHFPTRTNGVSRRIIACANPNSSAAETSTPTPPATPTTPKNTRTRVSPAPRKIHPWLIIGIGNPGNKFLKTRHNVGFEMIDAIAEAEGIKLNVIQQKALTGKGQIGPAQVLLAKPQTYVNLTGEAVGPLAAYYRIPVQQILVIFDDTDLEFGIMRLAAKGGPGMHNGVKSVMEHLKGCKYFPRLRIGIGKPPGTMDPGAFVLQRFDEPEERQEIDALLKEGPRVIRDVVSQGIDEAILIWNEVRKSRMQLEPEELEFVKRVSSG